MDQKHTLPHYKNILIVDDDTTSIYIVKSVLETMELGDHILAAHDGVEALEVIDNLCLPKIFEEVSGCPDLILLDINMPRMNGFEFLEHFNKLSYPTIVGVKIIMLSSSSNPRDIEKSREMHVENFLDKPLTNAKLTAILDRP